MAIPDYETIMRPLLELCADGEEHGLKDSVREMAAHFRLSEEEVRKPMPSGRQTVIYGRVGWAKTYMEKAGLVEITQRGRFRITEKGRKALSDHPEISTPLLRNLGGNSDFFKRPVRSSDANPVEIGAGESTLPPLEALGAAYECIRKALADEVLNRTLAGSPEFFENLVVDLLLAMGYGLGLEDRARIIGKKGDGGVDGLINQDKLGLDSVYIQAKKWKDPVGAPIVRDFIGALHLQRAQKGVLVTTSSFTPDAARTASGTEFRIALIDGNRLAELMIDFNIGVSVHQSYVVKQVDSDYFSDD